MTRAWLIILAAILVVLLVWLGIVVRKVNAVPGGREASKPAVRNADGPAGIGLRAYGASAPLPGLVGGWFLEQAESACAVRRLTRVLPHAVQIGKTAKGPNTRVASRKQTTAERSLGQPPISLQALAPAGESGPLRGTAAIGSVSDAVGGRLVDIGDEGGCDAAVVGQFPGTALPEPRAGDVGQPASHPSIPSDALWRAMCFVESSNNLRAYNAAEQAAGIVQIRPIALEDANRIRRAAERKARSQRATDWTLEDRFDPAQARRVWLLYLTFYGEQYQRATGKPPTDEVFARIWNGNPMRGWKQKATLVYWQKVNRAMTPGGV